jgi:hypothetical protein
VEQICNLQWMFGDWAVTTESINGEADPLGGEVEPALVTIRPVLAGNWLQIHLNWPNRTEDLFYIGFNADEARWTRVSVEGSGYSNHATARQEPQGRLVFEGDVLTFGKNLTRQRHTYQRKGPDEFTVVTEIRTEKRWAPLETVRYRRRKAAS